MDGGELMRAKREEIMRLAARHSATNVQAFGSVARGEADPASDLDLLDVEPYLPAPHIHMRRKTLDRRLIGWDPHL
jgi:predicted nucleotidyltransferase